MIFIAALPSSPLKAMLPRGAGDSGRGRSRPGFSDIIDGLIAGARNMIGIAVATGAAGIIVGTVIADRASRQVVAEFVEFLSGGNLMAMLVLRGDHSR
ncbi:MAG: hypothetical protein ACMVO3_08565 [Thalassobaculum sp.]